ncbi:hypothetical protein BU23DRAFT_490703, partial [Bimuria novae-zelandiae CBS 107.79]
MSFLRLPRELRDEVYFHYVYERDGYFHDVQSNRLRTSTGAPIDLALMRTCKQVASEMDGLALRENTIVSKAMKTSKARS